MERGLDTKSTSVVSWNPRKCTVSVRLVYEARLPANNEHRALPRGPKRDHFLSLVSPEAVAKARKDDSEMFAAANYGLPYCVPMIYEQSAIWVWGVCEMDHPPFLFYTDV